MSLATAALLLPLVPSVVLASASLALWVLYETVWSVPPLSQDDLVELREQAAFLDEQARRRRS